MSCKIHPFVLMLGSVVLYARLAKQLPALACTVEIVFASGTEPFAACRYPGYRTQLFGQFSESLTQTFEFPSPVDVLWWRLPVPAHVRSVSQAQHIDPHLLVSSVTPSMSLEHLAARHGVVPGGQTHLPGEMGNVSNASVFISTLSEREDLIFGTLYLVFGIVSLSGNSLLLLVAYQKRSMLKPAEFFIVNLAISDLSMTVTLFPLATSSFFAHRWLFNQAVCTLYAFCGVLFGLCSLTSLTVLSTVCCLKVCYPAYGNKFSPCHAGVLLLCVWVYALMFATAPLAEWGSYGPEPYGTACCITWKASSREATLYILALFIFCYLLPCLLILVSYSLILWTVRVSRRAVRQHTSPQRRAHSVHSLVVKLSIAVCLGFLAAWTPYAIVALWAVLGDASQVPALAFVLSAVFAKSSTLYNPLVYLLFKPNFQKFLYKDKVLLQAIRTLLCCGCPSATLQPFPSPGFSDHPGTCRNCNDTFECFSNYPKCYKLPQAPSSSPQRAPLGILAEGAACQTGLKRTVQVMVLVTRKRSGLGAVNVAGDALPSDIMKDLL